MFHTEITIPETILVYFIGYDGNKPGQQIFMFKRIPFDQTFITMYTSFEFYVIFVALCSIDYHLTYSFDAVESSFLQKSNRSFLITIRSLQRCLHIRELLNNTLLSVHILRRLKYHHLPCQVLDARFRSYARFHSWLSNSTDSSLVTSTLHRSC